MKSVWASHHISLRIQHALPFVKDARRLQSVLCVQPYPFKCFYKLISYIRMIHTSWYKACLVCAHVLFCNGRCIAINCIHAVSQSSRQNTSCMTALSCYCLTISLYTCSSFILLKLAFSVAMLGFVSNCCVNILVTCWNLLCLTNTPHRLSMPQTVGSPIELGLPPCALP